MAESQPSLVTAQPQGNAGTLASQLPVAVGLGEVLWDKFPEGAKPGGAPANFAFHATQLGCRGEVASRVGVDVDGSGLLAELAARGLSTRNIQRDDFYATGTVRVSLIEGQPEYTITEPAAWDFLEWTGELEQLATSCDAVCFGTLAQRNAVSREMIQRFLEATTPDCLRIFDVNLRQRFYDMAILESGLQFATVLKLNRVELATISQLFQWQAEKAVENLFARFPLQLVALTLGAEGCELFTKTGNVRAQAPEIKLVDAVGAGDAFSAALVVGLLQKQPLEAIAVFANRAGSFVASQAGAMPPTANLKPES